MRVRLPDRRHPGRWRDRLPALALVWAVVVAIGVVPIGLGGVTPARADGSGSALTVQGPLLYHADTQMDDPNVHGSVTVSQTKNLTNQTVHVSWTNFTPTVDNSGNPWTYGAEKGSSSAFYQVRVYQCRGKDPLVTDCYDSTLFNADPVKGFQQTLPGTYPTAPDFPSNMAVAVTSSDGVGGTDIELLTADQSASLGCDDTHPCSLVVEPNYGGDAQAATDATRKGVVNCQDHTVDLDLRNGTDNRIKTTNRWSRMRTGEQCAWEKHVTVPLEFAHTPNSCQVPTSSFSVAGLEPMKRAMEQWQIGLCAGPAPMLLSYGFQNGDSESRGQFLGGSKDLALTARPDTQAPPPRPYVYSPISVSGISVVFIVDDPDSKRQIRTMRLNARLMAKLLTQSYNATGDDIASVTGNPSCFFSDPEFQKLNPTAQDSKENWPKTCYSNFFSPTVFGGISDMTYQLTSWIASDPDAVRFLDGEYDPWGMHVNTYYLRPAFSGYPVDSLLRQDNSGFPANDQDSYRHWKQYEWNPVATGIGDVVRKLLLNKPNCVKVDPSAPGVYDLCPPMKPGTRTLIGIMDSGQAKAYSLPEAELLNPAGGFVGPGGPGFQAAVADMTADPATGTQSLPYGAADSALSRDQKAYPLTTVDYAMLPTQGVAPDKVTAMTKFMRAVTTSGQVYGQEPGNLAKGYLALSNAQRTQAADAISHLQAQDGKLPGNQAVPPNPPAPGGDSGSGDGGGSGSGGTGGGGTQVSDNTGSTGGTGDLSAAGTTGGAAAAAGGAGAAATGAKASATTPAGKSILAAPVAAGTPAADRSGAARLLLPVALIGGLVLLVGGPAALFLGGTPAGERAVAGVKQIWARVARRP